MSEGKKINTPLGCLIILVASIVMFFLFIWATDDGVRPMPGIAANRLASVDNSPEATERRNAAIQELIDGRVILKIERPADYAHVFVLPRFYSFTIDEKRALAMLVYLKHHQSDSDAMVIIYDGKSGKQVGRFDLTTGLTLD